MASMSLLSLLMLGLLAAVSAQQTCSPLSSKKSRGRTHFTVDPWIVPSMNTTNGALPPGQCPFSTYPLIEATCKDKITFITRSVPAGLRVHGVYLIDEEYVDQATGNYRCPSAAMTIDLRNGTGGGYANPAACRALGITSVLIDGTRNMTAPFEANAECSGYHTLDPLVSYIDSAPTNCSTSSITIKPSTAAKPYCFKYTSYTVDLKKIIKRKLKKPYYLAFSCPQLAGNQPGSLNSHCILKMTQVVKVTC